MHDELSCPVVRDGWLVAQHSIGDLDHGEHGSKA